MEKGKKDKKPNFFITAYLVAYNVAQFLGWTYIYYLTVTHLLDGGPFKNLWKSVELWLRIFQTGALLEVVHGAVGFVKTNPVMALIQIYSRVLMVWGISGIAEDSQNSIGLPLMLTAWCITEIIRYSFYFLNLLSFVPSFLTWSRYTFFIILYPLGITGELLSMYSALPKVRDTRMWSIDLPNRLNFSFNYYYYIIFMMIGYIPIFPQLYLHMFGQRRKVLSPSKKAD